MAHQEKQPHGGSLTRPAKGETMNPNGRPKGARSRSTIVKEWLSVEVDDINPVTGETERLSQADIITLALIKKAHKGDVNAFKELMDSCFGKVATIVEQSVTTNDDIKKLKVEFVNGKK